MPPAFPLAPFLQSLHSIGLPVTLVDYRRIQRVLATEGEWTHAKLQQVLAGLLAHNREQQAAFAHEYQRFFALADDASATRTPLDTARLRQELQMLAQQPLGTDANGEAAGGGLPPSAFPAGELPPTPPWWKQRRAAVWLGAVLLGLLLVFGGQALYRHFSTPANPTPAAPTATTPSAPTAAPKSDTITVKPTEAPVPATTTPQPEGGIAVWWWLLPLAGAGFTAFALYRRWQLGRIPKLPPAPYWDKGGEAYFDPARIGGRMPEWLPKDTLDYCADSVGFFLTDEDSHEPDMPATIRATAAAGGMPDIRLLRRKQLLHLLVLVDALAEGAHWNPLAEELADGLRRRGLPVTVGRLRGGLREFHTDDGQHTTLLDLAEERGRYVTLIFADANLLDTQDDRDLLDEIRQWPQLAWLTFREPRHWGGAEQVLQQHGLHLWEASAANLPDVFRHLAGEMLRHRLPQVPDHPWLAQQPQELPEHYLLRVLGDSLPLARLAALFPPPVGPALLVRLALTFFPHLPLARLQRLYRLPSSTVDAGGLHLPSATLKLLRAQFGALNTEAQRRATIHTLLEWLLDAEPQDKPSPAWWAWRWRYARLLAEAEPDKAYPMLAEAANTGLFADGIAADLGCLPIPLPQQASTRASLYRLGRQYGHTLLDKAQALPGLAFWGRAVQAGGVATVLLAASLAVWQFWPAPIPPAPATVAAAPVPPATPPTKLTLPAMVKIPAGTFQMGCVENNKDCQDSEKPVHSVTVPAFELGAYEVTVGQFRAFVDATQYQTTAETAGSCYSYDASGTWNDVKGNSWRKTGYTQTDDSPVTCVSWDDAKAYTAWLSQQTQQAWRLPTEAEWEYAARAGTKTTYSWGDQPPVCDTQATNGAQFTDCKEKAPLKVGSFKPNPFGLYDVHGNAWEWVEDCWGDYKDAPADGTARPVCDANASRVLRGGSWANYPRRLRSADRSGLTPDDRGSTIGFRAARTISPLPSTGGGTAAHVAPAPPAGQVAQPPPQQTQPQPPKTAAVPKMLPIPAGTFTMGCDPKRDDVEGGCSSDEKPPHAVTVPPFLLSETDVTVAQYLACVDAGGCPEPEWREKGSDYNITTGKNDLYKKMGAALTGPDYPIVGVSWQDAQAYVLWLSTQTGKTYRLPTEAEWEYAARAGTNTAFPWGNKASHEFANYGKDQCCDGLASGKDKWVYTSPVGSFAPNPFGLYDMQGNVWQWVEDCWQADYNTAPADGSARGGCDASASRVLRGGSWGTYPRRLRSASRYGNSPDYRFNDIGFRAARTN